MDQPVLTVEQLTKTYRLGKVRALDNLSLSFAQGVYGILGPNGAGKSTLMSIITGAVKADEGRVLYRGEDVSTDWQAFKKHFGYMPQQQQIYPHMTVADFLCYIAALKGLDKIEIRTQVREVIQRTDLEEYASRKLGALSGGIKQRVLISQALLGDPDILILDEPTAGLDPRERVRVRNFISELSLHKTILLATHVVSDIESVARHIIFMKCGQVLLTGTPADILQRNDHIAWEFEVKQEEIPALLPNFNISHLQQMADGSIKVRITADELPQSLASFQAHAVKPTLEDCYLHYFGDEPDSDNEHKAVSKSWGKRR